MDQMKAMQEIAQTLQNAFRNINAICANFLVNSEKNKHSSNKSPIQNHKDSSRGKNQEKQTKDKPKEHPKEHSNEKPHEKAVTSILKNGSKVSSPKPSTKQNKPAGEAVSDNEKGNHKASKSQRPAKPASGYLLFSKQNRPNVTAEYPELKSNEIMGLMGNIWNDMNEDEKAPFQEEAKALRIEYESELIKYLNKNPEDMSKAERKMMKKMNKDAHPNNEKKEVQLKKGQKSKRVKGEEESAEKIKKAKPVTIIDDESEEDQHSE